MLRKLGVITLRVALVLVAAVLATAVALGVLHPDQVRTLASLQRVDDYPLYVMHYYGDEGLESYAPEELRTTWHSAALPTPPGPWACTVYAALSPAADKLLGRNFDWSGQGSLLLFTHPKVGYRAVTMVDLQYFGLRHHAPALSERLRLLGAPLMPFDGLNEKGLAVGMMAVPEADAGRDPARLTVSSLLIMRLILDYAATVDEAVALVGHYNLDFSGSPPLHYLVADRSGQSAVLEFVRGELKVLPNAAPYQAATNFVLAGVAPADALAQCDRYRTATEALSASGGKLSNAEALRLLQATSQPSTMWSITYNLTTGEVQLALGRHYERVQRFQLAQSK